MSQRFLSKKEVRDKVKLSNTEIARRVKTGRFPMPLRLGPYPTSRTVWWEHEVDAWMHDNDKR
jgi:predicted DNA-binding transcriptional regulator AlpA